MRAGELRHLLTIDTPTQTRNELGEYVESGTTEGGAVYAAIRPTSAREAMQAGTLAQEVTHIITMRYTDAVKPASRLGFGDRTFEVAGIINIDECDVELQVLAKEIT